MIVRDVTMTSDQLGLLRKECNLDGPNEGACQILCGSSRIEEDPWEESHTEHPQLRLTVHRIEPLPSLQLKASPDSVSWDMDCYFRLLRKVRDEQLNPGICHSHPNSGASFSLQDDKNEAHLRDVLARRNKDESQVLVSILLRGDGGVEARVWSSNGEPQVATVRIVGSTVEDSIPMDTGSPLNGSAEFLQRQVLSVGQETVKRLQHLRVGVVGCGGTGSATAVLLARAGIRRLLLLDPDIVCETNLNRLHGATRRDVEERRPKVEVLGDHIRSMGLSTKVSARQERLANPETAKLLRSCDVIFGCTDDHLGRLILNRLAYFYYIPVIDTGLSVNPRQGDGTAHISGRVTVLRPGNVCLLCRQIVNPNRAREQELRYRHPDEYDRQVKEGYITGSDTPTPVIGTFTTETGAAAVNEFLAGFARIRGDSGWASERTIRYDLDRSRRTGANSRPECPVCVGEDNWGLGDTQPFLDLAGF